PPPPPAAAVAEAAPCASHSLNTHASSSSPLPPPSSLSVRFWMTDEGPARQGRDSRRGLRSGTGGSDLALRFFVTGAAAGAATTFSSLVKAPPLPPVRAPPRSEPHLVTAAGRPAGLSKESAPPGAVVVVVVDGADASSSFSFGVGQGMPAPVNRGSSNATVSTVSMAIASPAAAKPRGGGGDGSKRGAMWSGVSAGIVWGGGTKAAAAACVAPSAAKTIPSGILPASSELDRLTETKEAVTPAAAAAAAAFSSLTFCRWYGPLLLLKSFWSMLPVLLRRGGGRRGLVPALLSSWSLGSRLIARPLVVAAAAAAAAAAVEPPEAVPPPALPQTLLVDAFDSPLSSSWSSTSMPSAVPPPVDKTAAMAAARPLPVLAVAPSIAEVVAARSSPSTANTE
ncbi:unnamed protein product, partial [Ectocarpus sp. 13 AM-2016]